jgi:hypothetical protein
MRLAVFRVVTATQRQGVQAALRSNSVSLSMRLARGSASM